MRLCSSAIAAAALFGSPACAAEAANSAATLSPANMFVLADTAADNKDLRTAEAVYRALSSNPALEIRNEARFRHAMLLISKKRLADGATLLRTILDEQPDAQRARLELAAVLATIGDEPAARRELRAVRAGDLPAEVAEMVDRFSAGLRARKPYGGSLRISIASDSNINRATRSDTLGTVIGDFVLDDDAKAKSGKGIATEASAYGRLPLGSNQSLLVRAFSSSNLYRRRDFNDVTVGAQAGPELRLGSRRLGASAGLRRRWFGGERYSTAVGGEVDFTHSLASIAQVRGTASAFRLENHRNELESGWNLAATASIEAALSPRTGAGISLTGVRQALKDPGYSTVSKQASLFAYRELGRMTLTASASVARLEGDERLFLYPERRKEWLVRGALGVTARQFTLAGFAPTAQVTFERNHSSIEIYDYRRTAFEFGVARAF